MRPTETDAEGRTTLSNDFTGSGADFVGGEEGSGVTSLGLLFIFHKVDAILFVFPNKNLTASACEQEPRANTRR
jgi:hypothetical protein